MKPDQWLATAIGSMLQMVPDHIAWALGHVGSSTAWLLAKRTMLQDTALAGKIVDGQFYAGTLVASLSGGSLPVVAVFPLDTMRAGAEDDVAALTQVLPILERFFERPLLFGQDGFVRLWYGFIIGNFGGGGTIEMEDRATYAARVPRPMVPHEAILYHELAHSYVGHESLTQYVEMYLYNMVHMGSPDPTAWIYLVDDEGLGGWIEGAKPLVEVHALIGWEAMARAFRRIYELGAPYGVPLSRGV